MCFALVLWSNVFGPMFWDCALVVCFGWGLFFGTCALALCFGIGFLLCFAWRASPSRSFLALVQCLGPVFLARALILCIGPVLCHCALVIACFWSCALVLYIGHLFWSGALVLCFVCRGSSSLSLLVLVLWSGRAL